ncbi:MAG: DUF2490 domain-containing protein [Cyclobacteriaceae bacterium]|nr:MAG: DUF2490 domain-containing protein [Cyclobacteriaceae bacterium]
MNSMILSSKYLWFRVVIGVLLVGLCWPVFLAAQTIPEQKEKVNSSELWLGFYTKYRIKERLYYYGEYHLRRKEFIDQMGQIYLRFGLSHIVNKNFEITGGIVTPFYWSANPEQPNTDKVVPQFRFWQQFLFITPFDRLKVYHQIRLEQRWRRDFVEESPFELSYRFRYKILGYYPLNNHKLVNKTLFLSMYEEIFIQAGKPVVYDHMEDNRIFLGLGYILNENMQFQLGYQWSFRHSGSPFRYENRHMLRLSFYHSLDFYQKKNLSRQPVSAIDPFGHH